MRAASLRLGYPRHVVKKRAQQLALSKPRKREPPWSGTEVAIVEKHASRGAEYVRKALAAAGYQRTLTAVVVWRKRNGCAGRGHGAYSLHELAGLLGVDPTTVGRWHSLGLLTSQRRGTSRTAAQGGDDHHVTQEQLRAFVLRSAHLVDLCKVPPENHLWFIDLVSGGLAGLRVDEASEPDGAGRGGAIFGHDLPG